MTEAPETANAEAPNRKIHGRHAIRSAVAALVLGLVSAMFLAEGLARIIVSRSSDPMLRTTVRDYGRLARLELGHFRFVPGGVLPYRLKPGFKTAAEDGRVLTAHNALGFRGNFEDRKKLPGTLRVICLGGSTTYGVTVAHNSATYPAALERYLSGPMKPAGWERAEVFNLGVGGYTSREVLENLRLHGLAMEPDLILIQSAVNDVVPRFYTDFACDYAHFRKPMRPIAPGWAGRMAYRSHLFLWAGYGLGWLGPLTLQSRVQHPLPPAAEALENLAKNGVDCFRENIEAAVRLGQAQGAVVCLLTQAYLAVPAFEAPNESLQVLDAGYRSGLAEHNEVLREVARDLDAVCIDLGEAMPLEHRYFADPIHMTETGNTVKARLVAEAVFPLF